MGKEVVPDIDEGEFGFHKSMRKTDGRTKNPGRRTFRDFRLLSARFAYDKTSRKVGTECQEVNERRVFMSE